MRGEGERSSTFEEALKLWGDCAEKWTREPALDAEAAERVSRLLHEAHNKGADSLNVSLEDLYRAMRDLYLTGARRGAQEVFKALWGEGCPPGPMM